MLAGYDCTNDTMPSTKENAMTKSSPSNYRLLENDSQ